MIDPRQISRRDFEVRRTDEHASSVALVLMCCCDFDCRARGIREAGAGARQSYPYAADDSRILAEIKTTASDGESRISSRQQSARG